MTPFIIWLNKQDIDTLITMIVKSDTSAEIKDKIFLDDELVNYIKNLVNQNNELLKLLKKIELANPINKVAFDKAKAHQKCFAHRDVLKEIILHCSIHNANFKYTGDSMKILGCDNCSLNNS